MFLDRFLNSLEKYAYRVFLWEGKRSNAGISAFYRWGNELFTNKYSIKAITDWVKNLVNWYSDEDNFTNHVNGTFNWYENYPRLLRYTLYEYELYLLEVEGKGHKPKLAWKDLTPATFEHIYPQTPKRNSQWKKDWTSKEVDNYLHDISNIVLTENNPTYSNSDYIIKRGVAGEGICYANSDIRQERKISAFKQWTPVECKKRKKELSKWIMERWGNTPIHTDTIAEFVNDDE